MKKKFRVALLDMNDGKPNQGMRCIKEVTQKFLNQIDTSAYYDVYDVRQKEEVPAVDDYDVFISSGGPGSPYPSGFEWEDKFNQLIDDLFVHNLHSNEKKYAFLICHSFQLACYHWELGNVCPRRSTSFGILPVHKTAEGQLEKVFHSLSDPFYVVDSRDYQVIEPNDVALNNRGAKVLAIEKVRTYVDLERAMMAIRFSNEIIGTQFHPEADAEGMLHHFTTEEKKVGIIKAHGEEKYYNILESLKDSEKIEKTQSVILPRFLQNAFDHFTNIRQDDKEISRFI